MSDEQNTPIIPDGWREVTKDAFFAAMGGCDVHPSVAHDHVTLWKLRDGRVIGRSLPGWKYTGDPKVWMLPALEQKA